MRTSLVFTTVFLTASAIAIPFSNTHGATSAADGTVLQPQLATRDADLTSISRRRGRRGLLDSLLGTVTGTVDSVTDATAPITGTVSSLLTGDLLPSLLDTVESLDATVAKLLQDLTGAIDLAGTLASVSAEVQATIAKVNAVLAALDVEGTLEGLGDQVAGLVAKVQALLDDVDALVASGVDVGGLRDDVQTLLGLVTGLLGSL